ncbi:MAG: 50S ribosomal protein L19e [Fervidicoccaceae archaeon]|uniref:Large ribosomal subunit protein eL19 n=1 Tax=Fervidicoccus fontis TaxID=683846 RepID=A0A7C2Z4H0_9CREN|nr:MAG: 50S ribosomal protein L19e [Fervidicoccus sp.]HEU98081.1 50S ribosomal protein L19e [Fervidicoccus fontis]
MSDLTLQKRIAAELLGVGISRVRILASKEDEMEEVESAITADDVRKLIKRGLITAIPAKANSRGRWRRLKGKSKSQRRGYGSRKGTKTARSDPKKEWVSRIRKMRKYLKYLRDKKMIDAKTYRKYYMLAKGGAFASLSALRSHIEKEMAASRR